MCLPLSLEDKGWVIQFPFPFIWWKRRIPSDHENCGTVKLGTKTD